MPGKTRATPAGGLEQQRAAESAAESALADIRSTAEKWAASLAILLTGAGLAALVTGPKKFEVLADRPQDWGKGLFFAGAVCGVAAAVCAAFAAQATAKRIWITAGDYKRTRSDLVARAWRQLTASRLLAVLAVSLLLASTAFLWFGRQHAKTNVVTLKTADGKTYCGNPTVDGRGSLRVKGRTSSPALKRLSTIRVTTGCPNK